MIGFIYIMSNPLHPDVVKIGQSSKDPNERRKELGTTGVLEEFKLEYRALTENYDSLEREIHIHLASVRVRADREFFKISVPDAIEKIREIAGNRIESDKIYFVSEEEIQRRKDEKQRIADDLKKKQDAKKKIADDLKKKQDAEEKEKKDAENYKKIKEANEILRQQNRLHRRILRFFNFDTLYSIGLFLYGVFIMACIAGLAMLIRG